MGVKREAEVMYRRNVTVAADTDGVVVGFNNGPVSGSKRDWPNLIVRKEKKNIGKSLVPVALKERMLSAGKSVTIRLADALKSKETKRKEQIIKETNEFVNKVIQDIEARERKYNNNGQILNKNGLKRTRYSDDVLLGNSDDEFHVPESFDPVASSTPRLQRPCREPQTFKASSSIENGLRVSYKKRPAPPVPNVNKASVAPKKRPAPPVPTPNKLGSSVVSAKIQESPVTQSITKKRIPPPKPPRKSRALKKILANKAVLGQPVASVQDMPEFPESFWTITALQMEL